MDGIFFDFPLCSIRYIKEDRSLIDYIISWCIVIHANNLEDGTHKERVNSSARYLGVVLGNYSDTMERYNLLNKSIQSQLKLSGKDSYCRMGKMLTFEARDGQFDFNQYRVLCAIHSILGKKKKFVRITYDRIRYAMHGYRSKELFLKSAPNVDLFTDRRLKYIIDILHSKKFFSRFTYGRRQIYYSTMLDDDEKLRDAVKLSKIYWQKTKLRLEDKVATAEIKKELEYLRCETRYFEQQKRNKLRLVKAS